MPNFIVAVAVWHFEPTRPHTAEVKPGWLARHNNRSSRPAARPNEPYVDLSPLDLTRRH
jgi:hypothetical protein